MTLLNVLTLDLSLTATGWAFTLDEHGVERAAGSLRGVARLAAYQHWLITLLDDHYHLVVLEGYAYAKGNQAHQIGEWGGTARLTIHQAGIPFVEIPPATLKKYATGRGNAPKPDMRMALYKRSELDIPDDNQVDAIWLLAATHQAYQQPLWEMPQANVEALGKIDWPTLELVG